MRSVPVLIMTRTEPLSQAHTEPEACENFMQIS